MFIGTIVDLVLVSRLNSVEDTIGSVNEYKYTSGDELTDSKSILLPRFSLQALLNSSQAVLIAEFSAICTLRHIFTMKKKNTSDSFDFIHGFRVLSLFWVIFGHSFTFRLSYATNVFDVLVWSRNIAFHIDC